MKTYKITDLKRLAAEQGYKLAALENSQGVRILPFNQIKKSITLQLDKIPIRLKSELQDDGVYWVLMAHSINTAKNPDRYPIVKGKVNPEDLKEAEKKTMPLTAAAPILEESNPSKRNIPPIKLTSGDGTVGGSPITIASCLLFCLFSEFGLKLCDTKSATLLEIPGNELE